MPFSLPDPRRVLTVMSMKREKLGVLLLVVLTTGFDPELRGQSMGGTGKRTDVPMTRAEESLAALDGIGAILLE